MTTAGSITIDATSGEATGVKADPSTTYTSGAVYTFYIEVVHAVEASGFIIITLPSTIGTTGSGTNADCQFGGRDPDSCSVDDDAGTITI